MGDKGEELQREVDNMLDQVKTLLVLFVLIACANLDMPTAASRQITKERIFPFSRSLHLKMAECYNTKSASTKEVQRCVQNAAAPEQHVQHIVQNELKSFESRMRRCMAACQDEVNDRYPNLSEKDLAAAQAMYDKGQAKCIEKSLSSIKTLKRNIEQKLDEVLKK
jgi:hypothetical protein